jgi:hypothetical protein
VGALLGRGLIREQITDSPRKADAALNTIWRNLPEPDGRGVLLFVTPAGLEAIGIERRPSPVGGPPRARARRRTRHGRRHGAGRARGEETGPAAQGGAHGRGPADGARTSQRALRRRPATAPSRRR